MCVAMYTTLRQGIQAGISHQALPLKSYQMIGLALSAGLQRKTLALKTKAF